MKFLVSKSSDVHLCNLVSLKKFTPSVEIEMPRSRRIGGSQGKKAHTLHGKTWDNVSQHLNHVSFLCLSLSAFLCPVFQREHQSASVPIECLTSSPATQSLMGQASTAKTDRTRDSDASEGCDTDIAQLFPDEDPVDVVMKVKIDDNDSMEGRTLLSAVLQLEINLGL